MGTAMSSPPLDLVWVSYLADAGIQHVTDYPAANHGAIITATSDSIAADGPITALTAGTLGLRVGLISNQIGPDPQGQCLLATLDHARIQHTIDPALPGTTPKLTVITDDAGTRIWFAWLDHAYTQLAVADLSGPCLLRPSGGHDPGQPRGNPLRRRPPRPRHHRRPRRQTTHRPRTPWPLGPPVEPRPRRTGERPPGRIVSGRDPASTDRHSIAGLAHGRGLAGTAALPPTAFDPVRTERSAPPREAVDGARICR